MARFPDASEVVRPGEEADANLLTELGIGHEDDTLLMLRHN
jgi:hypothetical protein